MAMGNLVDCQSCGEVGLHRLDSFRVETDTFLCEDCYELAVPGWMEREPTDEEAWWLDR